MKRMCVKRLPKVLVIQLKRFDYDWERYVRVFVSAVCAFMYTCKVSNDPIVAEKWQSNSMIILNFHESWTCRPTLQLLLLRRKVVYPCMHDI